MLLNLAKQVRVSQLLRLSRYAPTIAGIAILFLNIVVQPTAFFGAAALLTTVLNIACLVGVTRFPLLAWFVYLELFLLTSFSSVVYVPSFVFIAPLMVIAVISQGNVVAGIVGSIILWYAGSINPTASIFLPTDLMAATVWAIFLALSVMVGWILNRNIIQRRKLIGQWEADVENRRQELGQALHDSVAASLTSVIMRLEAAQLQRSLSVETKAELLGIAEQARESMREVRNLLKVLSKGSSPQSSDLAPRIAVQLEKLAERFKEHGFTVSMTCHHLFLYISAEQRVTIRAVLSEVATNIIKYAEPGSTVGISLAHQHGYATISIANKVKDSQHDPLLSTGIGLTTASSLMEGIGGKITTVSGKADWSTELCIPQ